MSRIVTGILIALGYVLLIPLALSVSFIAHALTSLRSTSDKEGNVMAKRSMMLR